MEIKADSTLVSYDVVSLFTSVPVDETISIVVEKAFKDDWFNRTYNLNMSKVGLTKLLEVATKNQLFQFDGDLYIQTNGVAMGSPLGPLMANSFLCYIEEKLESTSQLPSFYKRYVDDTLVIGEDLNKLTALLNTLNEAHESLSFTMEVAQNGRIPFLGMMITKVGKKLQTEVYRKPTDKGLYTHYQSHIDVKYKRTLVRTMLHRAYMLSSSWIQFQDECERLRGIFSKLCYPTNLFEAAVQKFVSEKVSETQKTSNITSLDSDSIRFTLPFKDQRSCDRVKKQLNDLSAKVGAKIKPIFTSKKLNDVLRIKEKKHGLVNQQNVVYFFKCDLCEAGYVGYTCRHLHQRIEEHKTSAVGTHYAECHGNLNSLNESFKVLKHCTDKLECLIYEMLYIKELKPSLNKQTDSVKAKVFIP